MNTGIKFNWTCGSKNTSAIKELNKNSVEWEYSHFGELTADFYGIGLFLKIEYKHLYGDVYEIYIA